MRDLFGGQLPKNYSVAIVGPTTAELERQLFERGKQVLGKNAGGMIANLLRAKEKDIALARAAIEQAATKQDPREFIGAIIRQRGTHGQQSPSARAYELADRAAILERDRGI